MDNSQSGTIKALYISEENGKPMVAQKTLRLIAGKGIRGDRYFKHTGAPRHEQVTLIESENIDEYNTFSEQELTSDVFKRNIVTQSVKLNDLVGQSFYIGNAELFGIELCEPCLTLAECIVKKGQSNADVVKALTGKGGLRAEIISGAAISMSDMITV